MQLFLASYELRSKSEMSYKHTDKETKGELYTCLARLWTHKGGQGNSNAIKLN